MGQLFAETKQRLIDEILDELAYGSIKYVSNIHCSDEYECKFCGASIFTHENKGIKHREDCIHEKAIQVLG